MVGLPPTFYDRGALEVAPELLGKVLVGPQGRGLIVEVEAYMSSGDRASHSYRGLTKRNATMFGPPGALYVYLSYGLHCCANVVCGPGREATAVLIRSLLPTGDRSAMRDARGERRPLPHSRAEDRWLCGGPGKLCQALGVGLGHDGSDLSSAHSAVRVEESPNHDRNGLGSVVSTPRVGISRDVDLPWRFLVGPQ